jgi:hypothetical protein
MEQPTQATSTTQELYYPAQRGIQFVFTLADDTKKRVTIDLLQVGAKTYAALESMAIHAMLQAGHDVKTFTHTLIY